MKWQPIIKGGKIKFDTRVIINSESKGALIAPLVDKISTREKTDYVFQSGNEKITDVTHFAFITKPTEPL